MKLLIKAGPNSGQELDVDAEVVVGRDPAAATLVIEDPEASRRHASLTPGGSGVTVADLGSTNGTYVNGERLESPRDASEGDEIRIGNTVLAVHGAIEATRISEIPPAADPDATAIGSSVPDAPPPAPDPEPEPVAASGPPEPPASPQAPPAMPPAPPAFAQQPPGGAPPPPGSGSPPPGGAGQGAGSPGQGAPPTTDQPPPSAPPGAPPAYPPVQYGGDGGYPIDYDAPYPSEGIDRWRPFFHGFLLIPHFFALFFVFIGVMFALIGAWFAILFTGKYPPGIFNFIVGAFRWSNRVTTYSNFMNDKYPPFTMDEDPAYPTRTRIDYPPEGKIARWRVFVQGLMAFPHLIVLFFIGIAQAFVIFIAFFAVLFTRKWPEGLFKFMVGATRWGLRVSAYAYWMTEQYPPFQLEP